MILLLNSSIFKNVKPLGDGSRAEQNACFTPTNSEFTKFGRFFDRSQTLFSLKLNTLKVCLQLPASPHVCGGTMEGSSEGEEVTERHEDGLDPPVLNLLYSRRLVRLHTHPLVVKHQYVAARRPRRGEEQWVTGGQERCLRDKDVPAQKHFGQLVVPIMPVVCVSALKLARDAWAFGVHKQLARTQRHKGAVYVHSILVLEIKDVDSVVAAQVTSHPFDAKHIGHLRSLHKYVPTNAGELGSVKNGLEFRCDELTDSFFELLLFPIKLVTHEGLRGSCKTGTAKCKTGKS